MPRKSRIPSRAIYNTPPLCPELPFRGVSWEQGAPSPIAPSSYAIGRAGWRERSSVPNGTRVSNIDLSRSLSQSFALPYGSGWLALFLLVSLPLPVHRVAARLRREGGQRREGFTRKSQPKPRSGGHSPATSKHTPIRDRNLPRDSSLPFSLSLSLSL